jgi:hypothetical protein|tara:strand:+ start:232 stop:696 length:465 start_codon:yes stop_codon:yes gene_type:complete
MNETKENNETKMRYKETWAGRYNDINYEICCHAKNAENPNGIWCYYIFLKAEKLNIPEQPKDWEPPWRGVLYEEDWLMKHFEIDFHSGITYVRFCSKDMIQIGCDYNHIWDEDMKEMYNEILLLRDCKFTIDEFLSKYPDYIEKESTLEKQEQD